MSPGTREQRQQQEKQTEKSLAIEREREGRGCGWRQADARETKGGRKDRSRRQATLPPLSIPSLLLRAKSSR